MSDYCINDLDIMARGANYNEWFFSKIKPYLGSRILEIGAGIGTFTERFLDRDCVVAIDISQTCIDYLRKKFPDTKNLFLYTMDAGNPDIMNISKFLIDTIVCINVLEHIEDDRNALLHMKEILSKGGRLILIVPALGCLYGSIDRELGHKRRYTKKILLQKLEDQGFIVERIEYMNSIGVFGWFLNNRILKRRAQSIRQVLIFDRFFVPLLRKVEGLLKPPFGMSIFAVGRKA